MSPASTPLVLVVMVGPQASGKTTVSRSLADRLRGLGESVALVELDQVAGMALPTLPGWDVARRIFGRVVVEWIGADLTCVIAEGIGSGDEVRELLDEVPGGAIPIPITVAVTAPFDVALTRARQDPTRGVSRERAFLSAVYREWSVEISRIGADLVIDTADLAVEGSVDTLHAAIVAARRSTSG